MSELGDNVKSIPTWQRLFFVLLYLVVACVIVEAVFVTVVVLQCGFLLLTGKKNDNLLQFASSGTALLRAGARIPLFQERRASLSLQALAMN